MAQPQVPGSEQIEPNEELGPSVISLSPHYKVGDLTFVSVAGPVPIVDMGKRGGKTRRRRRRPAQPDES